MKEDRLLGGFDPDKYSPEKIDAGMKKGIQVVMEGIATIIACMCMVMLVCVFLFDLDITDLDFIKPETMIPVVLDALITVVLYVEYQKSLQNNGCRRGKQFPEYMAARQTSMARRAKIAAIGKPRMAEFCEHWATGELKESRGRRLNRTPFTYIEWQKYFECRMTGDIRRQRRKFSYESEDGRQKTTALTLKIKAILIIVNKMKKLWFTPEMLMYDNTRVSWRRQPVQPSPEERLEETQKRDYIPTVIWAVLSALIIVKFFLAPTLETALYCLFKVFGMIVRGATGYMRGFNVYAVDGVNHYKDIEQRLTEYEIWLEDIRAKEAKVIPVSERAVTELTQEEMATEIERLRGLTRAPAPA